VNILFVCNEYPPGPHGGIGTLTRTLARGLASVGHRVAVVGVYPESYPRPAGRASGRDERDGEIEVVRLPESTGTAGWIRSRARLWREVSRRVREDGVELVEAPDWEGWTAGWPELPAPVVVRLSGASSFFASEMGRRPARSTFWLERAALRRADFVCSESRYLADATRGLFELARPADAVLYNPVELCRVDPTPPRAGSRVVFAGTLTRKKGVFSLFDAWPRIRAVDPTATLDVYGKDTREAGGRSVRALLEARALAGVSFRGQVPLEDLVSVFAEARAAVLPSYAEGFSLTPLHAMDAGCPVVGTRRGSGPEAIDEGVTGLLADPDRPEEIARAVIRLLADDGLARTLGENGRRAVRERFSLRAVLGANEAFYRDCRARFRREGRAA
jgi:glycosyltransferase involved in cell wall biosynthesis